MPIPASLFVTTPPAPPGPASFSVPGRLALEGGTIHSGVLRGASRPAEGDLIFTTAATGWGEILTDPSYAGQIVVLTHPMVGSYRVGRSELESSRVHARALVVTRLVTPPPGSGLSVEELLVEAGIPALEGVDTRALTLELRRGAARRAVIRTADSPPYAAVADACATLRWDAVDH
ncbi:MAG: carbamoyl-phosphate synthase domain-containing protein, partial [bacterium]